MFNKCLVLVGFIMAVGVVGNLAPRAVPTELRDPAKSNATCRYVGNSLYIGKRQYGDRKLTEQPVYVAASKNRTVTQVVNVHGATNITYIEAVDHAHKIHGNRGALPTLISGGPGHRNATIVLTSEIGAPIYFRVTSYGGR